MGRMLQAVAAAHRSNRERALTELRAAVAPMRLASLTHPFKVTTRQSA